MVNGFFYSRGSDMNFWFKMLEERYAQVLSHFLPCSFMMNITGFQYVFLVSQT